MKMGVILPASHQKSPLPCQVDEQFNVFFDMYEPGFGLNDTERVSKKSRKLREPNSLRDLKARESFTSELSIQL